MSTPDTESLTPDDVFELLSNQRRRMVLYYLRQSGGSIGMKELAGQIAAMENEIPSGDLTSQQRKRVYVSLYQTHLPKMAEMNTIEYDKEEGIVSLTDQTDEIDSYLTTPEQSTYPWKFHYLVIAIGGGTALFLSLLTVSIFDAISTLWVSAGLFVMFAVSAIGQYWYVQNRETKIPVELSQYDN
jgi:hypothetical protein